MHTDNRFRDSITRYAAGGVGVALLVAGAASAASAASTTADRGGHDQRGRLLSVTEVTELSPSQVEAAVSSYFGDTGRVRYGVTGYRITYSTIDPQRRPTTASGLVVLPNGAGHDLKVISYDHGTNPTRAAVASVTAGDGDREAVELFASAGYAAVAPDYLGLGTGAGNHPYMDLTSEVTASADMLDASRALTTQKGVALDPHVLVTGFSQGGPAAMGFARAIAQGDAGSHWKLGAVAPISGPFNVRTAEIPALLRNELNPENEILYISFWTVSMNRLYHFYNNPDEAFRQPYAAIVEGLYDGDHTGEEILSALPSTPSALLAPQYMARLQHPTGTLLQAMVQNDTSCDWHPDAPTRIYAADGDDGVAFANSQQCQAELAAHGAQVRLVDVGDVDHNTSAELAVPQVLAFLTKVSA
jgi:pimeloyl-ACP methyl ester carboxylesterase